MSIKYEKTAVLFPNAEVSKNVFEYCKANSVQLPKYLDDHADWTEREMERPTMMISRIQAQFFLWFAKTLNVKKILEIGCFTGFSALVLAESVKDVPGAKVITTEIDPRHAEISRKKFKEVGMDHIITLLEGPALDYLEKGLDDAPFDLVFLDANKEGYTQYLKVLLDKKLIRPGGVLLADNVLKWGLVADDSAANPLHTNADQMEKAGHLREFNDAVVKDERVEGVVLPIFDGVNMVRVL